MNGQQMWDYCVKEAKAIHEAAQIRAKFRAEHKELVEIVEADPEAAAYLIIQLGKEISRLKVMVGEG